MKKFLLILAALMCITIGCSAQTQWYKSTAFASATIDRYTGRYNWTSWQSSRVSIKFDLANDIITIYSPSTQYYKIYDVYNDGNWCYSNDGSKYVKYYVYDQDYDKGNIRLRIQSDGTSQLYVDFANVAWVYNVVRCS